MVKMDHLRACEIDQIQRSVVLSTKTAPDSEIYNIIKHDIAIFDRIIKKPTRCAKDSYYSSHCEEYKSDIKNMCKTIWEIISRSDMKNN